MVIGANTGSGGIEGTAVTLFDILVNMNTKKALLTLPTGNIYIIP